MTPPDFIKEETWRGYLEMRRRKGSRAPWTEFAAKRLIGKLEAFHAEGWDADYLLAEAAERGWTSVFLVPECPKRNVRIDKTREYLAEQDARPKADPQRVMELVSRVKRATSM